MKQASSDWEKLEGGTAAAAPVVTGTAAADERERARRREQLSHVDTDVDVLIIGAGASGVGCAVQAKQFGIDPSKIMIVERGDAVGSTFDQW